MEKRPPVDVMEKHTLVEASIERLDDIESEWRRLSGDDEFAVEMGIKFSQARADLKSGGSSSRYVEVREVQDGRALAILDMVDASRISTTKLLSVWSSPEYWAEPKSTSEVKQKVAELYSVTFIQVLATSFAGSTVDTVKLYGRTDEMLTILVTLNQVWNGSSAGWSSSMQGRWLVLSRNK